MKKILIIAALSVIANMMACGGITGSGLFLPTASYHCPAETGYTCISSVLVPSLFEVETGVRLEPWAQYAF